MGGGAKDVKISQKQDGIKHWAAKMCKKVGLNWVQNVNIARVGIIQARTH